MSSLKKREKARETEKRRVAASKVPRAEHRGKRGRERKKSEIFRRLYSVGPVSRHQTSKRGFAS